MCPLIFRVWCLLQCSPDSGFCVRISPWIRSPIPDSMKTADPHHETCKGRNGLVNNFPMSPPAESAPFWVDEPYLVSQPLRPAAKISELDDFRQWIWWKPLASNRCCSPIWYLCHFVWGMGISVWGDGGPQLWINKCSLSVWPLTKRPLANSTFIQKLPMCLVHDIVWEMEEVEHGRGRLCHVQTPPAVSLSWAGEDRALFCPWAAKQQNGQGNGERVTASLGNNLKDNGDLCPNRISHIQ